MRTLTILASALAATAAFALVLTASASVIDPQTGPRDYQPVSQYGVVTVTGPELLVAAGQVAGTNVGAEGTWFASNMCFAYPDVTYTFYWGDGTQSSTSVPTVPLLKTAKATHTYAAPGMYHIYVLASNSSCNNWSAPFVVNVGATPTAV